MRVYKPQLKTFDGARSVADALIEALESGTEDIFPDPMAKQLHEGWKADANAMEKKAASMAAPKEQ
jgi:hypothetical protein